MLKKFTILTLVASSALLLVACGNHSASTDSSSQKDKSASVSRAKAKASSKAKAVSESNAKASSAAASSKAAASSSAKAASESQAAASSSAAASSTAAASSSAAASSAAVASSQAAAKSEVGLNSPRSEITAAEVANHLRPLSWEPIKNADQAVAYLNSKLGDHGWFVSHGSVGMSAPIYFSLDATDGSYPIQQVFATGQYQNL